jgi:PqqA peptide cyclase
MTQTVLLGENASLCGPLSLVAEVTHRCPLHCVYCSNPIEMQSADRELSAEEWTSLFRQAAALGVLHLHLTGGEPLARPDLETLILAGRSSSLYVNMITSGLGLNAERCSLFRMQALSTSSSACRMQMNARRMSLPALERTHIN